ncbi:DNA-binding protein [Tranquillimonas rosea]|uniref:DNA-binding protein n=1 Tax=Tranquillimonas rosea TaxID=641238 RepID=UPI003BAA971E
MAVAQTFPPRLMQAKAAAFYLGMSRTKFLSLGFEPAHVGGLRLYDRNDLDAYADSLSDQESPEGQWDALFEGQSD